MQTRLLVATLLAGVLYPVPAPAQQPAVPAVRSTSGGILGYSGQRWSTDYGVRSGRCDAGALVLRTTDSRGTLLSTAGASRIGARIDARDRACLGGVLEFGAVGREVAWNNPATGVAYLATIKEDRPAAVGSATRCRVLIVLSGPSGEGPPRGGPGLKPEPVIACESASGAWNIP